MMGFDYLKVVTVLRPIRQALVRDHVFESGTRDAVHNFSLVNEIVDRDLANAPFRANCDGLSDSHDLEIHFIVAGGLAQAPGLVPGSSPGDDVKVAYFIYPSPHQKRPTAEQGVIPFRETKVEKLSK